MLNQSKILDKKKGFDPKYSKQWHTKFAIEIHSTCQRCFAFVDFEVLVVANCHHFHFYSRQPYEPRYQLESLPCYHSVYCYWERRYYSLVALVVAMA